ncbi:MAG: hypothetical protein F4Y69_07510 [Chloroflexi bacterium]|nr:hypothetical protein [Chloroflexota bacterium]MYF22963.1 hypothetical protein [Chloroflexota bacterium]
MTSTDRSERKEEPTTLEEANLPLDHAALLFAIADGLCSIGQLRAGDRAGQFSIFNFLIRCSPDVEYPSPDDRVTYAVLMQAGIVRRHGWYAHFWVADDDRPMRIALPAPISKGWHWHDDMVEISRRFAQSEGWIQAVGESVDDHVARFAKSLRSAEIVRSAKG